MALQKLAPLIERDAPAEELITALQSLADNGDCTYRETAGKLLDWVTWLTEKADVLQALEGKELTDKVRLWQKRLDYYLWADPAEAVPPPTGPGAVQFLGEPIMQRLTLRLRVRQQAIREFLAERRIERIDAVPGSSFVAGVIERSNKPPERTPNPGLHDRIYRVEPGEGGYRSGGTVLAYSLARRYEYHSGE